MTTLENMKGAFDLIRTALGAAKDAKDLLPESTQKSTAEKSLEAATSAVEIAEAEVAKSLGYHLCQCTFPPQIMLSKGYGNYQEEFECPNCRKRWPPPEIPYDPPTDY